MKKWQKITGIIALIVLAILNIGMCIFYSQHAIEEMGYLVHANYIIALFLFICLWRKEAMKLIYKAKWIAVVMAAITCF